MDKIIDDGCEDVSGRTEAKHLAQEIFEHPAVQVALTVGAVGIFGILVGRVIKKQSLAAQMREDNPALSYHQSICKSMQALGYLEHPFKV